MRAGRPVVEQFVDGGAGRPSGIKHVVDQQDSGAIHVERNLRRFHFGWQTLFGVVVTVKGKRR